MILYISSPHDNFLSLIKLRLPFVLRDWSWCQMGCFTRCDGAHEGFMGPKHLELAPLLFKRFSLLTLKYDQYHLKTA